MQYATMARRHQKVSERPELSHEPWIDFARDQTLAVERQRTRIRPRFWYRAVSSGGGVRVIISNQPIFLQVAWPSRGPLAQSPAATESAGGWPSTFCWQAIQRAEVVTDAVAVLRARNYFEGFRMAAGLPYRSAKVATGGRGRRCVFELTCCFRLAPLENSQLC